MLGYYDTENSGTTTDSYEIAQASSSSDIDGILYINNAGDPNLLNVDRNDDGRWLGAYYDKPDNRWNRDDGFVFVVSQIFSFLSCPIQFFWQESFVAQVVCIMYIIIAKILKMFCNLL